MKFILKTDYVSNEYADGTAYTLVELSRDEAQRILAVRQKAMNFLAGIGGELGRVTVDFYGAMTVFDEDEQIIAELQSLPDDGHIPMPDDFVIPAQCGQGRIELEQLIIHHDGEFVRKAVMDGNGGDYLGTSLPLSPIEQATV